MVTVAELRITVTGLVDARDRPRRAHRRRHLPAVRSTSPPWMHRTSRQSSPRSRQTSARADSSCGQGCAGFDAMRALADDDEFGPADQLPSGLPRRAPDHGIRHGLLFGTITRLPGADISIFANHGGRLSFSPQQCADFDALCRSPIGQLARSGRAPAVA